VNPHSLLIIDDNEDDVLLFRRAASRAGLTNPIVWMGDAREALDKLIAAPEFRRVLIVLDLNMPGLSGVEFCDFSERPRESPISPSSCSPAPTHNGTSIHATPRGRARLSESP
jgi:CheY-like chemotaxis protein